MSFEPGSSCNRQVRREHACENNTEVSKDVTKVGDKFEVVGADGTVDPKVKTDIKITDSTGKELSPEDLNEMTDPITVSVVVGKGDDAKTYTGTHDGKSQPKISVEKTASTAAPESTTDGGKTTTADDDYGDDGVTDSSTSDKKKDDGSSTIIIAVVIIFVIIIIIIVAAVVVIKKNGGAPGDRSVVSFENPMYDNAGRPKQNPAAGQEGAYAQPQVQSGGYQDVQPNAGYTQDGTYSEPFDNGQAASSGYMDVGGATAGGGGGNTGYMDVAPNQIALGDDDDDGEDV